MPQELLEEIDAEASALVLSRSGLIQEATARYVVSARENREAEVRRLRIQAAAQRMRRIGIDFGPVGDTARLVVEARSAEETRHEQ